MYACAPHTCLVLVEEKEDPLGLELQTPVSYESPAECWDFNSGSSGRKNEAISLAPIAHSLSLEILMESRNQLGTIANFTFGTVSSHSETP